MLPRELDAAGLKQIIRLYRSECAVRDIEVNYPELLRERTLFWFHVYRLRVLLLFKKRVVCY